MTIHCVMCKKEPVFGDKSRSFHKFPDNDILKQKWIDILGIKTVTKNTKLCSDHFAADAFVDSGYTVKRRLLATAVPYGSLNQVNKQNGTSTSHQLNSRMCNRLSEKNFNTDMNMDCSRQYEQHANVTILCSKLDLEREAQSTQVVDPSTSVDFSKAIVNLNNTNLITGATKEPKESLFDHRKEIGDRPNLKGSAALCDVSKTSPFKILCPTRLSTTESTSMENIQNLSHSDTMHSEFEISISESDGFHAPNASPNNKVPSLDTSTSSITKTMNCESLSNESHTNLKRKLVLTDSHNNSNIRSKKKCTFNDVQSSPTYETSTKLDSNKEIKNLKRSIASVDVSDVPPTKKFRFYDGSQAMYMKREDFCSDDAWTRFLKYTIYKKRQVETCRKKNLRKKHKIGNMNDLVSKLREDNASAAADYLQDLPEHLKQLISRMKDNKPTSPFPSHLKIFARSLHFHSPAAYEMVRQSFLKCLPYVETLNRWNCSKDYEPGISQEIIDHVAEMVQADLKKGKKLIFNPTFDEMGIKEWAHYCKQSKEWNRHRKRFIY